MVVLQLNVADAVFFFVKTVQHQNDVFFFFLIGSRSQFFQLSSGILKVYLYDLSNHFKSRIPGGGVHFMKSSYKMLLLFFFFRKSFLKTF